MNEWMNFGKQESLQPKKPTPTQFFVGLEDHELLTVFKDSSAKIQDYGGSIGDIIEFFAGGLVMAIDAMVVAYHATGEKENHKQLINDLIDSTLKSITNALNELRIK